MTLWYASQQVRENVSTSASVSTGALVIAASSVVLMVVGLVLGEPVIVLLAVPILLHMGYSWLFSSPDGEVEILATQPADAPAHTLSAQATTTGPAAQVLVRISAPGFQPTWVLAHSPTWDVSVRTHRTGVHELFRADYFTSDLLSVRFLASRTLPALAITAYPLELPLSQVPLPQRLRGLTGPHASSRPGESTVLRDIHPFTPGDELRRIDWRTSARRGLNVETGMIDDLYVRRTFATAEATIMIVIDSRDSISGDPTTWAGGIKPAMNEPTSLDLAREAGGSLAQAYLAQGDRLGVEDLGRRARAPQRGALPQETSPRGTLLPGAGHRHAQRVRERLAAATPWGSAQKVVRAPHLPHGAEVVMCSTFMDDSALIATLDWHRRGHAVLAVDTLPPTRTSLITSPAQRAAYRLIMVERTLRLQQLRDAGIMVITWRDEPASQLRAATRISQTAPIGGNR